MDLRAVAYHLGGERIGVLPDTLGMTFTAPREDTPTLTLSYPARDLGVRGELLDGDIEIAVEVTHDGATWEEPPNARFMSFESSDDLVGDGTDSRHLDAVHVSHRLSEALVWSVPTANQDSDGKWNFLSVTAGVILRTLWDAAVARGWGTDLTIVGNRQNDANGQPWEKIVTLAFDARVTLLQVVETLVSMGMIDVRWQGRRLEVYNADTALAVDRSASVIWRLARGTSSAPEARSTSGLCTHLLVSGENGYTLPLSNTNVPPGTRRVEKVVEAGGVSTDATARLVAASALARGANPAEEILREWKDGDALLLPWRDYSPGEWISVERKTTRERLRVAQVSVTKLSSGAIEGHTTFGTRIDDAMARLAKKQKGVVGGASVTGPGVRPIPVPKPEAKLVPGQVMGVILGSDTVLGSDGSMTALLQATWAAVGQTANGQAVTTSDYQVRIQLVKEQDSSVLGTVITLTTSDTTIDYPVEPGRRYRVQVRALNNGLAGTWSQANDIVVELRNDPPPTPSQPVVTSTLGVLTVRWDGKASNGAGAPPDVVACEVSAGNPGDPAAQVSDIVGRRGGAVQVPAAAGGDYDVALRMRDSGGLWSPWTTPVRVTATSAVDMQALEDMLTQGQALTNAAQAAAAAQAAGLNSALAAVAASLAASSEYPPDEGTPGQTMWVGPDSKVWEPE